MGRAVAAKKRAAGVKTAGKARRPATKRGVKKPVVQAMEDVEPVVAAEPAKRMRAAQCSRHLRRTVIAAYAEIVAGFVEQAKKGGCQHLRLATELVQPRAQGGDPDAAAVAWIAEFARELDGTVTVRGKENAEGVEAPHGRGEAVQG